LNAVFARSACQHRVAKVSEDTVVAIQSAGFELRSGFHSGHILQRLRGDVLDAKQGILCLGRVHILSPIEHAAPAGDSTQRSIVPQNGTFAVFQRLCFKAHTVERNADFFEVAKLLPSVAVVHVMNLLVN
jgi:hypothetical protein